MSRCTFQQEWRVPPESPLVLPYDLKRLTDQRETELAMTDQRIDDATLTEIEAWRDDHWDEVLADIERLVEVESVEDLAAGTEGAPYGPGPREALSRALAMAQRAGLDAHDCEGYIGYADLAGQGDTQIGIIGHVDVVPAGPGWSVEPYALTKREGYLLGRGVIDDKGPITVALHAVRFWAERFATSGQVPSCTIRVLFGANEETNMKDVEYYRAHHVDPDFLFTPDSQFPLGYGESGICSGTLVSGELGEGVIVELEGGQAVNAVPGLAHAVVRASLDGLPERDDITVSAAGEGLVRVEAQGVSAHASTPELGKNAIALLVGYLYDAGLCNAQERQFLGLLRFLLEDVSGARAELAVRDEHFGDLSMVGGVIRLEEGRIYQSFDVRYPTKITAEKIERRFNKAAYEFTEGAYFTLEHDKAPFLMDPNSDEVNALLDAYRTVTGEDVQGKTSKGGTYARCFTKGVSFGPEKPWVQNPDWVGSMHGPDEGVSEGLLKEAFAIYALAIGKLLGQ